MKRIMVLAGGYDQITLISNLRNFYKETYIILIDYTIHPIAAEFADKHLAISTLDLPTVLEAAKREQIDRIITACTDQALVTMAYVSQQLQLPCYLTYEEALLYTNKKLMKNRMRELSIPTSSFKIISSGERSIAEIENIVFDGPYVVKPVDANSSKGVIKVKEREELSKAYREAKRYSNSGEVIIEQYISGKEYSVDIWVDDGKAHILLITETVKLKSNQNYFTIIQSRYAYEEMRKIKERLTPITEKLVKKFQIHNTPMILQILISGKGVSVIEFSARTGGGSKAELIRTLTGFDVMSNLLRLTEKQSIDLGISWIKGFANMDYVYTYPGIFKQFAHAEGLKKSGWLVDYFQYKSSDTPIGEAKKSSDRVSGFLVSADTWEELVKKEQYVETHLVALDEGGADIMMHGIY